MHKDKPKMTKHTISPRLADIVDRLEAEPLERNALVERLYSLAVNAGADVRIVLDGDVLNVECKQLLS
jgi:hypothetical protein